MGRTEFALFELSIVARGAFMPHTIHPDWLSSNQLIGEDDLSASKIEVLSPEITAFRCGGFRVQVMPEALQISTADLAETERVRDLMIGILRTLPYAPLMVLGLNRSTHFTPDSEEAWHEIGDRLAPKKAWEEGEILTLPGMVDITLQGVRPDKYGGFVQIQVQPSAKIPASVFVSINDHFNLTRIDSQPTERGPLRGGTALENDLTHNKVEIALEVLTNEWNAFTKRAENAIEFVAGLGGENQ
ncbi:MULTISPECIES: hypothetical protein [Streptomyces]|uniref:hypothetical protein n=1 Tax=Streptomyces TaxID=1883 RepID=UPI001112BD66|nr:MULTISPECIES: hypothetical protein [Streptomyces]WTD26589.1 hypothetical protein OH737_19520 [Streptomyces anulatus]